MSIKVKVGSGLAASMMGTHATSGLNVPLLALLNDRGLVLSVFGRAVSSPAQAEPLTADSGTTGFIQILRIPIAAGGNFVSASNQTISKSALVEWVATSLNTTEACVPVFWRLTFATGDTETAENGNNSPRLQGNIETDNTGSGFISSGVIGTSTQVKIDAFQITLPLSN